MAGIGGIPMPSNFMDAFKQGFGITDNLMRNLLSREQLAKQMKMREMEMAQRAQFHGDSMALQREAQNRLNQKFAQEMQERAMLQQLLGGGSIESQIPDAQTSMNTDVMPQAQDQESMGQMGQVGQMADQVPVSAAMPTAPSGFDSLKKNPLIRAMFKKQYGFDIGAETPEQKRAMDLQSKLEFEQQKTQLKKQQLKDKEFVSLEKDLPTLEKSLKGVDQLLQIAKTNPDLFGHGFLPERFSKVTKNKNFGTWQNLLSDAIAGLEQKLSSKGNIVALKMAAQLKPSHAEQQEVAIGKLESMKSQLKDQINNSKKILGKPIDTPSIAEMSDDELMKIAGGEQ